MSDLRKAAEQALEALERALSDDQPYIEKSKKAAEALRQALAQPEQEPVAWRKVYSDGTVLLYKYKSPIFGDHELEPLYTAPPKREWVGLTRLELDIATLGLEDLGDCYAAIEAKPKEKNT